MEPDVRHSREGIQLSFGLPGRLNATCVYPRKPSNGSTVVICAHSDGLRVLWYAGRKQKSERQSSRNGNSVDLTDDDSDRNTLQYEDEEEEVDPARPFHNVLTYTDIPLDSAATKIAPPPIPSEHNEDFPHILKTHIVFVAACADLSLRLIALPIEPSTRSSGQSQQIVIQGSNSHRDLISSVAITVTGAPSEESEKRPGRGRSRSGGREAGEDRSSDLTKEWSFLLASTSTTGTGLLLIHKFPIEEGGQISDAPEHDTPVHRQFLRTSLAGCHIEFNQSLYPSERHTNLLIAPSDGTATKIYQVLPRLNITKRRRSSGATADSTTSVSQQSKKNTSNARILINLLTPFHDSETSDRTPARKRVLDARWILHGRAVLVLLDDGEWGIWDIEAAGPTTSASAGGLVKGSNNASGIQGGSVSKFAIKGKISSGVNLKQSTSKDSKLTTNPSLAPMTPHTRKTRSQGFFKGQDSKTGTADASTTKPEYGSLAVLVQSGGNTGSKTQDESIILSYGSENVLLPSIQSYWRSESNDGGSFGGTASAKPVVLPQLQKSGEAQLSVHLMPQSPETVTTGIFPTTKVAQSFVVATASRLVLFLTPLAETINQPQVPPLPTRLLADSSIVQDQVLLDSGELDIDGMDRILNNMANTDTYSVTRSTVPPSGFGRKSVGFQLEDEEGDVDMETPTASKNPRSKLTVNKGPAQQNAARRLFT